MSGFVKFGSFETEIKKLDEYGEKMLITFLARIGEEAVRMARLDHMNNWNDQSGNLRSSINYGIYKNGREVMVGQSVVYKDGGEGAKQAKDFLQELGSKSENNYTLIIVAGMNYASYVENIYHKDVLTGASQKAEELAKKLIKGL